ncbi:MAG: hypothetical protein ACXV6L_01430 [Halobacteriota archaeon]
MHDLGATTAGTGLQTESEKFSAQQRALYKNEIGGAIAELLHEASERAFTHDLWVLDDRFLARIDALCGMISARATIYYGISNAANRSLLRELEQYVKQLASGLDVVSAQLNEDILTRGSPPRYQKSIDSVFDKIQEVEKKLLER